MQEGKFGGITIDRNTIFCIIVDKKQSEWLPRLPYKLNKIMQFMRVTACRPLFILEDRKRG